MHFNVNPEYVQSLKTVINSIPGIDSLRQKPIVTNEEVSEGVAKILKHVRSDTNIIFCGSMGLQGTFA